MYYKYNKICVKLCYMNKEDNHISFRANKENTNLVPSLRELARKAGRRLNDYLNIVLSQHVKKESKK